MKVSHSIILAACLPLLLGQVQAQNDTELVGTSYCEYAPNEYCYESGWPSCCDDDSEEECPAEQPPCEILEGSSYCTWAPDYGCFTTGWPSCCDDESEEECPAERPACESSGNETLAGESYCTYAPNYACYSEGWPSCCDADTEDCPEELPACDLEGGSFCTFAPNYGCYTGGWPACCDEDESTCPQHPPDCDVDLVGASFCTFAPDYGCYINGWPSCCGSETEVCNTDEKPACEIPYDAPNASHTGSHVVGSTGGLLGSPPEETPDDGLVTSDPTSGAFMKAKASGLAVLVLNVSHFLLSVF